MPTGGRDGLLSRAATWYLDQQRFERGKGRVARALVPRLLPELVRTTVDGFRYAGDPRDLVQYNVLVTGQWEPEESKVIRDRVRPGVTFYDIGAHSGYFTLLASKLVGEGGQVYAYEPNEAIRTRLEANLALNGVTNVTVFDSGVSDVNGTSEFSVDAGRNSGVSSLRSLGEGSERRTVRVLRLDDQIVELGLRPPDFVKMDVEGAEQLAVSGMATTLSQAPAQLLIEVSDAFLRHLGGSEDGLLALLDGLGYRMEVETSRHARTDEHGRPFQYNALFTRKDPSDA